MQVKISVDQSKNEFNNPSIKKGDFIIDIDGNVYLVGYYKGGGYHKSEDYVIALNSGEDSYNDKKWMPVKYKKLKKDDFIKIKVS